MNKLVLSLSAVALAAAVDSPLAAQPEPTPEMLEKVAKMLTEADLNGDGKTSRSELNQHRTSMFGKLDRNSDGVIDQSDSPKIPIAKRKFEPAFEQVKTIFDANKDGRVTTAEWNRTDPDIFALLDANEDGFVTRDELPTAM